jgi:transposase InsO family protein
MAAHRLTYSVVLMCKTLGVSKSGFYKWKKEAPERGLREQERVNNIKEVHSDSRGTYGSPRVEQELRKRGINYNHKSIEKLMQQNGLRSKQSKKFKATTNSKHKMPVAENVLQRDFHKTTANQAWVSDITYIWTDEGWLYLVVFIDLWSRRVIGWSMSDRMQSEFVRDAFLMACQRRNMSVNDLLVHSDRGSQFASDLFKGILAEMICKQSMSRKGNCWDNAVAESFFGSLKKELIHHERYKTREQARTAIFDYIEVFYNRNRIHSTLNYLTPEEFERKMETAA